MLNLRTIFHPRFKVFVSTLNTGKGTQVLLDYLEKILDNLLVMDSVNSYGHVGSVSISDGASRKKGLMRSSVIDVLVQRSLHIIKISSYLINIALKELYWNKYFMVICSVEIHNAYLAKYDLLER